MQLYIHLPFCKCKCQYCDFNSYAGYDDATVFSYMSALTREIGFAAKRFDKASIDTVYIGGGTPSMLEIKNIARVCNALRDNFDIGNVKEYTIECNPESIEEDKLKAYKDFGINRISIGVQSLNDDNLRSMGRLHDSKTAIEKIELASRYFDNVSADLIIGLPYDTESVIANEIDKVAPLVSHISMYELSVEEGTPLAKRVSEGSVWLPDDDEVADLFDVAIDTASKHGLERYEVSNFARKGRYSKHNFGYWTREEYLGIGAGAHSYIRTSDGEKLLANEIRFASPKDVHAYIAGINCVDAYDAVPRTDMCVLSKDDCEKEKIMLGLRTVSGVDESLLEGKIPADCERFFVRKDGKIALTREGMAVMNSILIRIE